MELILNLLWLALAATAVFVQVRWRNGGSDSERLPCQTSLLALACILVLLFPVISASDDLHPSQELFEEYGRRVQQTAAPLLNPQSVPGFAMLPSLLTISALVGPLPSRPLSLQLPPSRVIEGEYLPSANRAPPFPC